MSQEGDILPALEGTLMYFASYLARTVKHGTIKLYLAAVCNLHSSCGPLVRKRKAVIDCFLKWLDAFTAYALVIVSSQPWQATELFKY